MSFKLTVEILDDTTTKIDFDGNVNHIILVGVLESIKYEVIGSAALMAAEEAANAAANAAVALQEEATATSEQGV